MAVEVPAVMTIREAWQLVDLSERQQLHCMMLENCCYDYFELATAAMAQQGLLGEVVHGEGGYCHNLGDRWEPNGFANGAVTTTLMRTALGRTIQLSHDVQTPRPYSRGYRLVGTKGYADKYPVEQLWIDEQEVKRDEVEAMIDRFLPDDIRRLRHTAEQYDNRGGISYLMDYRLVDCLVKGRPLDMDVYDLAEWCAVVELSELSISQGSVPVAVPDFCRR